MRILITRGPDCLGSSVSDLEADARVGLTILDPSCFVCDLNASRIENLVAYRQIDMGCRDAIRSALAYGQPQVVIEIESQPSLPGSERGEDRRLVVREAWRGGMLDYWRGLQPSEARRFRRLVEVDSEGSLWAAAARADQRIYALPCEIVTSVSGLASSPTSRGRLRPLIDYLERQG